MQLIILAAGKGARLPRKFRNNPKCLAKIKGKTILDYNIKFYKKFKEKIIITGYKSYKLKEFIKKNNFKKIYNKKFRSTNMVHSLFLASRYIKKDTVICYSDIIFDAEVYDLLTFKKNILPININWLKIWKRRMSNEEIIRDAESLEINGKFLKSIGERIGNKIPRYQYMGIFKITKKTFMKLNLFYKKIKNYKIDMTTFLNLSVKNKLLKMEIKKYKKFWYEIDSDRDIKSFPKRVL